MRKTKIVLLFVEQKHVAECARTSCHLNVKAGGDFYGDLGEGLVLFY